MFGLMHERAYLFAEKFLDTFEDVLDKGILTREQVEKRVTNRRNFIHDLLSSAMPFDRFLDFMNTEIAFLQETKQCINIFMLTPSRFKFSKETNPFPIPTIRIRIQKVL